MRKLLLLLLAIALFAAGCSPAAPAATPSPVPATETPDVYVPDTADAGARDYLQLGYDLMASDGLGGLRTGMTEAQVTALLGQPEQASQAVEWASDGRMHSTWDYPSQGITLDMAAEKASTGGMTAASLSVIAPCALLTQRGIGIGSAKDAVLAAYAELIGEENAVTQERIVIGSVYGGMIVTLENGLVASLFIGASAE